MAPISLLDHMTGPALFTWCEEDYKASPWIAELHNTVSNIPYVVVGLITVRMARDHRNPETLLPLSNVGLMLILIGLGSMAFHGTLTRWGQAGDELAILWWEVSLLLVLFPSRSSAVYIWSLFVIENTTYWAMDFYPKVGWALYHPLHTMVDLALVVGLAGQIKEAKLDGAMRMIYAGLISIAIAFGSWLLDFFYCEHTSHFYLHAWGWHIFSCIAIGCLHLAFAMTLVHNASKKKFYLLGYTVDVVQRKTE